MVVAAEAQSLGRGGLTLVARVSGISYSTIQRGIRELRSQKKTIDTSRIRRPGAGRKKVDSPVKSRYSCRENHAIL